MIPATLHLAIPGIQMRAILTPSTCSGSTSDSGDELEEADALSLIRDKSLTPFPKQKLDVLKPALMSSKR
uniref:Uncharacterized protein n=1 Tax=Physcomitrium patens TaxID=3218 RepID=A0A2K1IH09_PHYPA|nr:hypothetical protein PHYPA_029158 [Physcomitrium patens]